MTVKVGINGFGRIGRQVLKAIRDLHPNTLEVVAFNDIGESWQLAVRAPQQLAKYIAVKGSITINGVSLTVNQVAGSEFEVNLIPHTLEVTTLDELKAGDKVNLEIDLIARYVERMLQAEKEQTI